MSETTYRRLVVGLLFMLLAVSLLNRIDPPGRFVPQNAGVVLDTQTGRTYGLDGKPLYQAAGPRE